MPFSVNTTALPGLVDLLDRRAAELFTGRAYLDRYTSIAWTGLANELAGAHRRVVGAIGEFLDRAHACADQYRYAVASALRYYLGTDSAAAARTDATLPGAHPTATPPAADPAAGPGLFKDLSDPTDALRHPRDHSAEHPYHPAWYDIASPTSIERDLVWQATSVAARLGLLSRPVDVFADFTTFFCGPWAQVLSCADAFGCLGALCLGEASATRHGADQLERVWTGNAASSCASSLREFGADLGAANQPLLEIADAYRRTAQGMAEQSTVMGQLLAEMIDIAGELAIEASTETAAALVLAPDTVLECARVVLTAVRTVHYATELVRAGRDEVAALGEGLGAITAVFHPPPLPTAMPALPRAYR